MNAEIILELLNYTSAYVVVLDSEMNIRFINIALSRKLGFTDETELLGRNWINFVPKHLQSIIKECHKKLLTITKNNYHEFVNDIVDIEGKTFNVKWINTAINHKTNWTFSLGIPQDINLEAVSEDEIRKQFHTVIKSNKQMIETLKEYVSEIPQTSKRKTENTF